MGEERMTDDVRRGIDVQGKKKDKYNIVGRFCSNPRLSIVQLSRKARLIKAAPWPE